MIKFLVATLLTALLSFVCGLFFPWWSIAVAAFLVSALLQQKPLFSFLSGFIGLMLLWGGLALAIDWNNNSILSTKIAELLHLGGSSVVVLVVTAVIGALAGGGGALSGSYLRKAA